MIDFQPSKTQQELKEEVISFVREKLDAGKDRPGAFLDFDREVWRTCGELKLPGLAIPSEYGGRGLSAMDTLIALEALGYASRDNGLNFSLSAHLLACVVPLWLYGSEELKRRYLPGLSDGTWIAANAMSEPGSGSDAFRMDTLAHGEEGGYRISGSKSFVSNGPVADMVLLYAATDPDRGFMGGISALWLDGSRHPFEKGPALDKAGLHSSKLGILYFNDLRIENSFLVGMEGRGAQIFNRSMEWERTCLGGVHIGNMQRLLEKAVQFQRDQNRNDREKAASQSTAFMLADLQMRLDSVRLMAMQAAWKMDQQSPAARESSAAKLMVSELYKELTVKIALMFQAAGLPDADSERSAMDALSSTVYSGTSEMQRLIIAQSMGIPMRG